jgi:hypothetical protein
MVCALLHPMELHAIVLMDSAIVNMESQGTVQIKHAILLSLQVFATLLLKKQAVIALTDK